MRNAWALFDRETGQRRGYGDGHLDTELIGDAVVIWRDTIEEILAVPAVAQVENQYRAMSAMLNIDKTDRSPAKVRKAECAARFLANVPEPVVIDPADPDAIPTEYTELYDEYWQTYDIRTKAGDPWHLARLIVQKARDKGKADDLAASLAEAKLRREKVLAESVLNRKLEPIPDD